MQHQVIPFFIQCNPAADLLDPIAESTAIELEFPRTFSGKAWRTINYLNGSIFLYAYKGRFVVTDESLFLTYFEDSLDHSFCCSPRFVGRTLDDVEAWLEKTADLYDQDKDIPGWEPSKKPKLRLRLKNSFCIFKNRRKNYD